MLKEFPVRGWKKTTLNDFKAIKRFDGAYSRQPSAKNSAHQREH